MPEHLDTIIPQIGALLHWNGQPGHPDLNGGQDWVLKGSCTLVGRNRVLAVNHIVSLGHQMGVFLPSVGLVPVVGDPDPEVDQ